MKPTISRGTGLLECMRQSLKDQWVTASDVRTYCTRAGGYTREVLDEAAKCGLVEKKIESKPQFYYKIDPPPEHSNPLCTFEPDVPYDESVCVLLENAIEYCVESKHRNLDAQSEYCDLLLYFKRQLFSPSTNRRKVGLSNPHCDVVQCLADYMPHRENLYIPPLETLTQRSGRNSSFHMISVV
jgi:hypothetical protein